MGFNSAFKGLIIFYENPAIYEKMWKNIVEPYRPQKETWHMRTASCKAIDTYL